MQNCYWLKFAGFGNLDDDKVCERTEISSAAGFHGISAPEHLSP
jgi:hypothetical protein